MTEIEWKELYEFIRDNVVQNHIDNYESDIIYHTLEVKDPKQKVIKYLRLLTEAFQDQQKNTSNEILKKFRQYVKTENGQHIQDIVLNFDEKGREIYRQTSNTISLIQTEKIGLEEVLNELEELLKELADTPNDPGFDPDETPTPTPPRM